MEEVSSLPDFVTGWIKKRHTTKKLQCSNVKKILGEIKGTDFRNFEIAKIIQYMYCKQRMKWLTKCWLDMMMCLAHAPTVTPTSSSAGGSPPSSSPVPTLIREICDESCYSICNALRWIRKNIQNLDKGWRRGRQFRGHLRHQFKLAGQKCGGDWHGVGGQWWQSGGVVDGGWKHKGGTNIPNFVFLFTFYFFPSPFGTGIGSDVLVNFSISLEDSGGRGRTLQWVPGKGKWTRFPN